MISKFEKRRERSWIWQLGHSAFISGYSELCKARPNHSQRREWINYDAGAGEKRWPKLFMKPRVPRVPSPCPKVQCSAFIYRYCYYLPLKPVPNTDRFIAPNIAFPHPSKMGCQGNSKKRPHLFSNVQSWGGHLPLHPGTKVNWSVSRRQLDWDTESRCRSPVEQSRTCVSL